VKVLARRISAFAARLAFLAGLFFVVVFAQVALTTGFIAQGLTGGPALLASGGVISLVVSATVLALNQRWKKRMAVLEAERERLGLPAGPCCVIWRGGTDVAMPWTLAAPINARFPDVARRLGVEGFAILEFEIGADGAPRSINCVDVWPAQVFYEAAAEALAAARFVPAPGTQPRFGASYRVPFVFRVRGAAEVQDVATRARSR